MIKGMSFCSIKPFLCRRRALVTLLACFSPSPATLADNAPTWISETLSTRYAEMYDAFSLDAETFALFSPLTRIQFNVIQANNERAMDILRESDNVCTGNKLRTAKREKDYIFTELPNTLFLGQHLYTSNPALTGYLRQNSTTTISINDISSFSEKLVFGTQTGRSYGEQIDAWLAGHAATIRVYERAGTGTSEGIIHMLLSRRVDFIFEYPNVLNHYREQVSDGETALTSFPVAEFSQLTPGYVMCSKSASGKVMAERINQAIAEISRDRRYLDAHLRWYSPLNHQTLVNYYNQVYGTDFTLAPISEAATDSD